MLAMSLWEKLNISQLNLTQPKVLLHTFIYIYNKCADKIQLGLFVTKKYMAYLSNT